MNVQKAFNAFLCIGSATTATIVFALVKFIWFICAHANTHAAHNILFVPHFGRYFRYSFNELMLTQTRKKNWNGERSIFAAAAAQWQFCFHIDKSFFGIRLWWYPLSRTLNTHQPLTPIKQPYLVRLCEQEGGDEWREWICVVVNENSH